MVLKQTLPAAPAAPQAALNPTYTPGKRTTSGHLVSLCLSSCWAGGRALQRAGCWQGEGGQGGTRQPNAAEREQAWKCDGA
jgi:hypothetical protein